MPNAGIESLRTLSVGQPQVAGDLTMFPVVTAADTEVPDYDTLEWALTQGSVVVSELPGGGTVPLVRLQNRGAKPVLVVDGEHLKGARQNRIANLTVLVPAKCTLDLPVVCAEAGRWSAGRVEFSSVDEIQFAKGRARKMAGVSASLRTDGRPHADQMSVWNDIQEKVVAFRADAPTQAMGDVFRSAMPHMDDLLRSLEVLAGQTGGIFVVQDRVLGFEVFDHATTYRSLHPKIARSFALDVLDQTSRQGIVINPVRLPEIAVAAAWRSFPAIGLGAILRMEEAGFVGSALEWKDRTIHLSMLAGA